MAEYLAPGVYVEEIPSANKPIQAASTSTAGMVGMTERGPLNTPTLTTSLGDYARKFGGALDPLTFTDGRDGLPYAAEGFFNNGGARLYVVRIAGPAAVQSSLSLISADATVTSAASLAMGANKGAVDFILAGGAGLAANYANTLILSDGDRNQSLTLKAATPFATLAYLSGGLPIDIPKTTPATSKATVLTASAEGMLALSAAAGTAVLTLEAAPGYAANDFVLIHNAGAPDGNAEFAEVLSVNAGAKTVTLKANMTKAHAKGSAIKKVVASATTANISVAATASTEPLTLSLSAYTNITAGTPLLLEDGSGTPAGTVRVVVSDLVNKVTLNEALAESYPAGSKISAGIAMLSVHAQWPGSWGDRLRLTAGSSALVRTSLSAGANANATTINLVTAFGLFPGSVVVVGDPLAGPCDRCSSQYSNWSGDARQTANLGSGRRCGGCQPGIFVADRARRQGQRQGRRKRILRPAGIGLDTSATCAETGRELGRCCKAPVGIRRIAAGAHSGAGRQCRLVASHRDRALKIHDWRQR
jgi:uncharacterized protein